VSPNVPGPHHKSNLVFKVIAHTLWRFNLVFWAVERYFARAVLGIMGVPEGLPLSTADRAIVQAELTGIFPIDQRIDGILFDTFISDPDINNTYPFGDITAPTLICHGRDDPGPHTRAPLPSLGRSQEPSSSPGTAAGTWPSVIAPKWMRRSTHSCARPLALMRNEYPMIGRGQPDRSGHASDRFP
jgi:hypothetical protein